MLYGLILILMFSIFQQILMKNKSERRALVQRALGIRRNVLRMEQNNILLSQADAEERNNLNMFP